MNADVNSAVQRCKDQLTWLSTIAQQAENHFWNTARAEYAALGEVGTNPRDISDDLCLGAEACCEAVLREVALLTGATHTPLDWAASENSLSVASTQAVVAAVTDILLRIQALASPPVGGYTHPPIQGAGTHIYAQVSDMLNALGPNFPTPITVLYPTLAVVGISAEVKVGDLDALELTLNGGNWPAGANWHELKTGDIVIITSLDCSGFSAYLNTPLEVLSVSTTLLKLTIPVAGGAIVLSASTASPTQPGSVFVVRKLRGAGT